ncbi:MAG TPA: ATP-binding protein [Kofleriaceae bacterium]|nr:ATP-binding protein [Kofleriaceae bacterium]
MPSRLAMLRATPGLAVALAVGAVVVAVGMRAMTEPLLGDRVPFIFLFPAVLFAAWFGGRLSGFTTVVLGAIGTWWIFPLQRHDSLLAYVAGLILFVMVSVTMIELVLAMRRAETRALRTQLRLDAVLEYAPLVVFLKDLDGRYLLVNHTFAELAGKRVDQIVGKDDRALFGDAVAKQFADEDRRLLERGQPEQFEEAFEYEGKPMTFLTSKFLLRDVDGTPIALCGIANDITDRKHAEAELKDADRRKDEFLAVLAHELRNPLAPIRLGLEMLRGKPDELSATRAMDIMGRQLAHLVRLIDDLLDVSRISRGKLELRREPVLLDDVLRSAIETAKPLVDQAGHTLDVHLEAEPVLLDADLTRLAQVLSNLVANASKYTPRGGRIEVRTERTADEVAIAVHDTGVGIDPEHLQHVFEMFAQLPSDKTDSGLGIGLALARRLVELHGGRIEARSPGKGRGSTFVVHLPIAATSLDVPQARPLPVATHEGAVRVLVADDNVDARDTLAMYLEGLGHDVRLAADGVEALRVAGEHDPDVAVIDIGMPGLDGYQVAAELRARGSRALLIALTGWGQPEDRRRSREAGFDHHLVKPVQPATLVKLLETRGHAA